VRENLAGTALARLGEALFERDAPFDGPSKRCKERPLKRSSRGTLLSTASRRGARSVP
jgi:hypothetical protein